MAILLAIFIVEKDEMSKSLDKNNELVYTISRIKNLISQLTLTKKSFRFHLGWPGSHK